jgi:glycosyltransferase involved in cell wall biosynthesis
MKPILYLYREIMPYNISVLKELTKLGFFITVVHYTKNKLTPYVPPEIKDVTFISVEQFSRQELLQKALLVDPCLVYVSDRTNKKYNYTTIQLRKRKKIPVISGCDTQWIGGKQWINVFTSWFRHKRFFSHILIAGMRQFEYAKRLGFKNDKILWPLNSADIETFLQIPITQIRFQKSRNFLYVGRFAKVKGLEVLLKAWSRISDKKGATLTLIGDGPLKVKLRYSQDVIIHDFMKQEDLVKIACEMSCFVLPSIFEPWALVIHEFAASGLPLIVSNACGAAPHFLINNYNGFLVKPDHIDELKTAIEKIILMPEEVLFKFATRSRELSTCITPKMVAHAITSVLK